jgi:hypothetical protein
MNRYYYLRKKRKRVMDIRIKAFWDCFVQTAEKLQTANKDEGDAIVQKWVKLLEDVNVSLAFRIFSSGLCMGNYHWIGPKTHGDAVRFAEFGSNYAKHMITVALNLEISAYGDITKFDLVQQVVQAAPTLPDSWRVISHYVAVPQPNNYITLEFLETTKTTITRGAPKGKRIPTSLFEFRLTRLLDYSNPDERKIKQILQERDAFKLQADSLWDLIIILNDEAAGIIEPKDIPNLKQNVIEWLISILGEYAVTVYIPCLSIIPKKMLPSGYNNDLLPGTQLINKLRVQILGQNSAAFCKFCGLAAYQVPVQLIHDGHPTFELDKYPYIRGFLCTPCIETLKRFLPQYSQMRIEFARS